MICKECETEYERWIPEKAIQNNLCKDCNAAKWNEWDSEHSNELEAIALLQKKGHSHHCACRQVWGDGECECDMYEHGYDPYAWRKKLREQAETIKETGG